MTAEQATQDILYLVYEAAIISPDPIVQETHVETSVRDILEEFSESVRNDFGETELETDLRLARQDISELEDQNEVLRKRLSASQELIGEYTGK